MRCSALVLAAIFACGILLVSGPSPTASSSEPSAPLSIHAPIRIERDSAFTSANGVVGGTGSAADPYVVEGWEVNASETEGISIINTTAFVIIRNVYVHSGWNHSYSGDFPNLAYHSGIYLWNAHNVRIENVKLYDNGNGVFLRDPIHVAVMDSELAFNSAFGIYGFATDLTILGNAFHDQSIGFRGGGSNGLLAANNFYRNEPGGILIDQAQNLTIRDNNFADSYYHGIDLYIAYDSAVYHNNVLDDYYYSHTDFGANNSWSAGYPRGGNYWSRYTGQDNCSGPSQDICPDPDGIGDTPILYGDATLDPYPLMHPYGPQDQPPTAVFDAVPATAQINHVIAVNASASLDPDGPHGGVQYRWDWDRDGTWDTPWLFSPTSAHAYPAPGTYMIRLETRDVTGWTNLTTRTVTIVPPPPDYGPFVLAAAFSGLIAMGYLLRRRSRRKARTEDEAASSNQK
jgi:parallel beta-helix repeat protein